MNPNEYQELALVTESKRDPELSISLANLMYDSITKAIISGNQADRVKKTVFYGAPHPSLLGSESASPQKNVLNEKTMRVVHAVLGLVSEAGEAAEALHSHLYLCEEFDEVNFMEEMGDHLWYIAVGLSAIGVDMEAAMERNIAKLRKRFPDGFTEIDALNRNLEAEQSELSK